jgi:phosphoribosylamine--glycine ligase
MASRSRSWTVTTTEAIERLDAFGAPYVIKADGLAAGKGVVIAADRTEAVRALEACLVEGRFGEAGATALIEEHLTGREVSAFALTDGRDVLPLVMAQDDKRVGDGDAGPNTGGMGAYSPVPFVDEPTAERISTRSSHRTVARCRPRAFTTGERPYAGLMLTAEGPQAARVQRALRRPRDAGDLCRACARSRATALACAEGQPLPPRRARAA